MQRYATWDRIESETHQRSSLTGADSTRSTKEHPIFYCIWVPVMPRLPTTVLAALAAAVLILGCASETYQLMPTPVLYQVPSAAPSILQPKEVRGSSTDVDLLYITDRKDLVAPVASEPREGGHQNQGTRCPLSSIDPAHCLLYA